MVLCKLKNVRKERRRWRKKRNKLLTWVGWAGRRKIYSFVRISTEMSIQRGGKGEGKKKKNSKPLTPK